MPSHTDLCEKMSRIRNFLQLKQADIAFKMDDISPSAYGKLERGELLYPPMYRFEQFAEVVGFSLTDLLTKSSDELVCLLIERRTSPLVGINR